ncbi:pyridoxamine 5'-phosphate oxidase family protein [Kineococcus gynurae]|uniref:Pyridoxamine 5'-phosphate oxidase family protein n=1 Tax=Kineococcus gynurae TaxID=452979 RepID=A0ABV5LRD7_9ACTN
MTPAPSPDLRERVAAERDVWLATLLADGPPHLVPVWFVVVAVDWWIGTDATSVKVGNVGRDPRVSLALPDADAPVVVEGTADILPAEFPVGVLDAFAAKYDGWDPTASWDGGGARVLLRVRIRRWLFAGTAH